uniref:DNA 3'-5' helicase n=1 Tax=Nothobranchius furzeri TaxID=105023 RepID=A0A8C6M118_NOTFU
MALFSFRLRYLVHKCISAKQFLYLASNPIGLADLTDSHQYTNNNSLYFSTEAVPGEANKWKTTGNLALTPGAPHMLVECLQIKIPFVLPWPARLSLSNSAQRLMQPTGFGKSLIYQLALLVAKKMGMYSNPVVVVVSPLLALIDQQVKEAGKLGLTAVKLGVNSEREIVNSAPQLVFSSPESWLLNDKWRRYLSAVTDLVGVVVNEVHLTYKWSAFRESFARLSELRSLVKPVCVKGAPILALTASAELESRTKVETLLLLQNATTMTESPNRCNIRLGLKHISGASLDGLDWIIKEVKGKGPTMYPIIIYGCTIKQVGKLFCYLKAELQDEAWVGKDPEHKVENLLIGMFHSKTLQHNKDRVVASLSGEGNCRVVTETTTLVMGLNVLNIPHVALYSVPEDVEAIVQEIGRAGRDGTQSHAVVYCVRQHTKVDVKVKTLLKVSEDSCFHRALFTHFEQHPSAIDPGHLCCTNCHLKCQCHPEGCKEPKPAYELLPKESSAAGIEKEVTNEDKLLLKDLLDQWFGAASVKRAGSVPHQRISNHVSFTLHWDLQLQKGKNPFSYISNEKGHFWRFGSDVEGG